MGFWNVNLEAAQAHASQAGPWAKRWLQTMSEQTMHLAEQASSKLPPALHTPYDGESPPSPAELVEYGITPEFKEFVRSLTYSTFRDYHADGDSSASASGNSEPAEATASATAKIEQSAAEQGRLTPWQEKHALLVVQSVQEINELRFVLVPKRMADQDFWRIYFSLARKHLPAGVSEAPSAAEKGDKAQGPQSASGLSGFDLQDRLQQLSVSAKQWGAQASASLQAATASGQRQGFIPQTLWTKTTPGQQPQHAAQAGTPAPDKEAQLSASSSKSPGAALPVSTGGHTAAVHVTETELAEDPDLEAYLRDVGNEVDDTAHRNSKGADAADSHPDPLGGDEDDDIDEDFEKYISELNEQEGGEEQDQAAGSQAQPGTTASK